MPVGDSSARRSATHRLFARARQGNPLVTDDQDR